MHRKFENDKPAGLVRLNRVNAWWDSVISRQYNKLRSSQEVTSLFNDHTSWYEVDKDRKNARLTSFWSCISIPILYFLASFTEAAQDIWEGFRDDNHGQKDAKRSKRSVRVKGAPGQKLLRFSAFFFPPKTITLTFRPLVADWQCEYFEALKGGRVLLARFISLRYYWSFAKAFGLSKVGRFLIKVVDRS